MAFPSKTRGYVGEAAVYMYGILLPCVQRFTTSMYCPFDNKAGALDNHTFTGRGEPDDCLVFSAWQPTCFGKVLLCGE